MIVGRDAFNATLAPATVAAIMGALATMLGPEASRYRVTAVRPLGWAAPAGDEAGARVWAAVGRQEAAFVHRHFGEGRR